MKSLTASRSAPGVSKTTHRAMTEHPDTCAPSQASAQALEACQAAPLQSIGGAA
jgi:hypothetical protein